MNNYAYFEIMINNSNNLTNVTGFHEWKWYIDKT